MAKYYIYRKYSLRVIPISSYPGSHVTLRIITHPCLA
jgi:hypothetical protein